MTPVTDQQHPDVRTYAGSGLDELLPRIRAELGHDAVILARRDGIEGGVAGFFGRRVVELDAAPAGGQGLSVDLLDDEPDDAFAPGSAGPADSGAYGVSAYATPVVMPLPGPAPTSAPERTPAPGPADAAPVAPVADGDDTTPAADAADATDAAADRERVLTDEAASFARQLAGLMEDRPAPAAPAHRPVVDPRVDLLPTLDDADALVAASAPLPAVPAPAPPPALPADGLGPDGAALVATGISPILAADLVQTAAAHIAPLAQDDSPRAVLRAALAARIPIATPVRGPGGAVIGFVGPAGSGKTRCVARLATAYAKRSALPVACVTLRAADGGAELTALLREAGVTVHAEDDAAAASRRIDALRNETIVLVDTPGVSPRADAELRTLSSELRRLAADELHLTVPATIGPIAARELAAAGRRLGARGIALTHADETAALGTVVELAIDADVPLSYVARGTALDGGMRPASADALAHALLGPEDPDDELV
ncbi:hypothetical protein NBH00_00435 [Paraconexibacter antarcticus]|uniref:SRP54-type proteins GTP-binding domain-containing protein n=1 Tax=Paraconexibacter antarcticus TaxID=2949664 RepID=A0ABY5DSN0_9ACTN|nr:hypothetical protein [Paraconexibacter antarcticus]UTI64691.1 hypothetical protein NBH00_00435 [Paraconexibacter antarcticus]